MASWVLRVSSPKPHGKLLSKYCMYLLARRPVCRGRWRTRHTQRNTDIKDDAHMLHTTTFRRVDRRPGAYGRRRHQRCHLGGQQWVRHNVQLRGILRLSRGRGGPHRGVCRFVLRRQQACSAPRRPFRSFRRGLRSSGERAEGGEVSNACIFRPFASRDWLASSFALNKTYPRHCLSATRKSHHGIFAERRKGARHLLYLRRAYLSLPSLG